MTSEKNVPFQYITSQRDLSRFLAENEDADWIGYDTEFISEGRYLPELCLVQVSTPHGNYIIDSLIVDDLTPFWERVCRDDTVSLVHACRSELEFCYRSIKRFPSRIFDVQLAAAFVGLGYPLNFKTLASVTINVDLDKSETLTDWRRRPLLDVQLRYAINDVCHLSKIAGVLRDKLERKGRLDWFKEEMKEHVAALQASFSEERWRKVCKSGINSRDELATLRELWFWRHDQAIAKNIPPSRVMRDDVLVSLAKRHTTDPERIAVMRGISGRSLAKKVRELSKVIQRALALPDSQKPRAYNVRYPAYKLATKLVGVLLAQYCHIQQVSYLLFTTSADIRQAIAAHEGTLPEYETARLTTGWRKEFLGEFLDNILNGQYAMQLTDNLDEDPLRLVVVGEKKNNVVLHTNNSRTKNDKRR